LRITYTSAALLSCILGLLIFFSLVQYGFRFYLVGIALFCVGFIIRPESSFAALLLTLPILGWITFKYKGKILSSLTIFILAVFVLLGVNSLIDSKQTSEFTEYKTWAKNVQKFAGQPRIQEVPKVLGNTGWTPTKYNLLVDLAYFDSSTFNNKWITPALDATSYVNHKPNLSSENLKKVFTSWLKSSDGFIYSCLIMFVVLLFYLFKSNNIKIKIYSLSVFFIYLTLITYLRLFRHSVSRVTIPMLIGTIFISIFFISLDSTKISNLIAYPLIVVSGIIFMINVISLSQKAGEREKESKISSDFIQAIYANKILLIHGNQEFTQNINPFIYHLDKNPNVFMVGNWDTFSPYWQRRATNLGINSEDMVSELLNNRNVLWSGSEVPNTMLNLINYLAENGYGDVLPMNIGKLPNGNNIWEFALEKG
jgi:hypothetical protein